MKHLFIISMLLLNCALSYSQQQRKVAVYFDVDQYVITNQAAASLDSFINADIARFAVQLFGYCDASAGFTYNDALSLRRVNAVKKYLANKGFDTTAITEAKSFGKRKPLNSNLTAEQRSLNRRVEIVFDDKAAFAAPTQQQQQTKSLAEQIKDTSLIVGKNIILKNLNFYGGTHRVLPESMPVLQELLAVMRNNPSLEIAIEGHVCCTDGPGDGLDIETTTNNLSENRAKEIYTYLVRNGVASSRLRYKGFGHRFPLTQSVETTEEERIANRRVEIQILKR